MTKKLEKTGPAKDEKTGRFVTGNSGGGRPKGSRQELAREFLDDMRKIWGECGPDVLRRVVELDPAAFLRAMTAIMPKEIDLNVNRFDEMSLEQLKSQYAALAREARALGLDLGAGDPASLH
jgi:hypothetical protein